MNEKWIIEELNKAEKNNLLRHVTVSPSAGSVFSIAKKRFINFSSNDYLNLIKHPTVLEFSKKAIDDYGAGSGASRLVSGSLPIHHELEEKIASHKNYTDALIFGSGYMTNIGVIPAIANKNDVIFSDKLVHSCILDGIHLSGAKHTRFHHNDVTSLEERLDKYNKHLGKKIIIIESVYSMDGDLAPLQEITRIANKHNAILMVDEAHATGTFGLHGRGRVSEFNLESQVDITMGTMSKGMGSYGGFIACSSEIKKLLIQKASSFIYTTAPPPSVIGASLGALHILEKEPDLGLQLQTKAKVFRKNLHDAGIETLKSESQIIPIIVGDNISALTKARKLKEAGIIVGAIRPPTVPTGTSRLRISLSLGHNEDDIQFALEKIIKIVKS